jgi:hypothetical protein
MMNMRRTLLSLGFLLGFVGAAFAPHAAPTVQQSGQRADAATLVSSTAPAVNATQATGTVTITPPAGQYVYFTGIYVAACGNGTASASSIQQNFTTTNLSGLTIQTSILAFAATTAIANNISSCDRVSIPFAVPLKSAAPGGVVTIVPPAQNANFSYPIITTYYFSP